MYTFCTVLLYTVRYSNGSVIVVFWTCFIVDNNILHYAKRKNRSHKKFLSMPRREKPEQKRGRAWRFRCLCRYCTDYSTHHHLTCLLAGTPAALVCSCSSRPTIAFRHPTTPNSCNECPLAEKLPTITIDLPAPPPPPVALPRRRAHSVETRIVRTARALRGPTWLCSRRRNYLGLRTDRHRLAARFPHDAT